MKLVLPAHAGVILGETNYKLIFGCITRTCGGDPLSRVSQLQQMPYYPHMRGWSHEVFCHLTSWFVLPAHAGVILEVKVGYLLAIGITRTCGGDPSTANQIHKLTAYYPHMRGWSRACGWTNSNLMVLPAHAGVILADAIYKLPSVGITRTCGGDPLNTLIVNLNGRYYPHMRGWSCLYQLQPETKPVLPAHAGVILGLAPFYC